MKLNIRQIKKSEWKDPSDKLWEKFEKELNAFLDKKKHYYAIEYDQKIIGYIQIDLVTTVAYLNDLIIKRKYRNKKIGHQVLEFFINFAKKHKCHKIRVKTCPERNPAAYHLYQKYGLIEECRLKNDYFNKDWVILSRFIDYKKERKSED